jgi:hypothetical protein
MLLVGAILGELIFNKYLRLAIQLRLSAYSWGIYLSSTYYTNRVGCQITRLWKVEGYHLLGYNAVQYGISWATFRINTLPPFKLCLLASCLPYSSTLKTEAVYSPETSVNVYRTTRRYIPEYNTLHSHRWNPQSRQVKNMFPLKNRHLESVNSSFGTHTEVSTLIYNLKLKC